MKKSLTKPDWILLIHQLPPKPTSLRVRVWRKLQRIGAVAIKNSVYVLPFNEKTYEDFQWLKQEIETAGGEVSVFRAGAVEGATDDEIIKSFKFERDEEYAKLAAELDALTGALREQKRNGSFSVERVGQYETGLDRLHVEMERIISIDFFNAGKSASAIAAYKRCQKTLRSGLNHDPLQNDSGKTPNSTTLPRANYQGKRWVTRRNIHIDRLASAWLIKRFIDERPRFYFVSEEEKVAGGIHFDMFSAEFTHVGDDCTFETLIKSFNLTGDASLREIAEIVHDIDLKDGKFNRLEAKGLDATVSGMSKLFGDDRKLIAQCCFIFNGLYEQFSGKNESLIQQSNTEGERKQ